MDPERRTLPEAYKRHSHLNGSDSFRPEAAGDHFKYMAITSGTMAATTSGPTLLDVNTNNDNNDNSQHNDNPSDSPYSVFSKNQKRYIAFMASWAGLFSPLSSLTYLPVLPTLSRDLDVSMTLINLTLTSYMIFQGLSPMFISDFANNAGRRPAYMACFLIYIGANIGLAIQNNYAALFVLRAMQSAGSSGTIALSSGVVGDIATTAERGSYMGYVMSGTLLGPSLGPVIGGLLAEYLGWRAIFWFLLIFSTTWLVPFLLLFPETSRRIVGNGSIPPPKWNMSLISYLQNRKTAGDSGTEVPRPSRITFPWPWRTFSIIFQKDMSVLLLASSINFSGFYLVSAAVPYTFQAIYGLNALKIGLCFIPLGIGSFLASIVNGWLLDYNYHRVARGLGLQVEKNRQPDLRSFPIEKARLQAAFPMLVVAFVAVIIFGWCLHFNVHVAAPIIVLLFIGLSITAAFNTIATLMVDLFPDQAANAMAANNVCRCLLGAGSTAVLVPMLDTMGSGWCFTFVSLIMLTTVPMMMLLTKAGPRWREEQRSKQKAGNVEAAPTRKVAEDDKQGDGEEKGNEQ